MLIFVRTDREVSSLALPYRSRFSGLYRGPCPNLRWALGVTSSPRPNPQPTMGDWLLMSSVMLDGPYNINQIMTTSSRDQLTTFSRVTGITLGGCTFPRQNLRHKTFLLARGRSSQCNPDMVEPQTFQIRIYIA